MFSMFYRAAHVVDWRGCIPGNTGGRANRLVVYGLAAERSAGNLVIEKAMNSIGSAVSDGNSLADSFAASGLFPPLILRMIRVGETTGALALSLENVAYFYTRDVRESIGRLQSMIEPIMTLLLGVIIGWVMFSVLGPIYDLITDLGV